MGKTARGVYYDLHESEWVFTIGECKFFFSSKAKLNKFWRAYQTEQLKFNQSLNNVYKNKFLIDGSWLAWLRHYSHIETNGFYIILNGVEITCLNDLTFQLTPNYNAKLEELIN